MFDWIKENSTAFVVALVFHFIFFGALFFNWQMDKPKKIVMQQGDIIQVTSVDANSYDAEIKKIEQQKQAKQRIEKQRKAEAERKAQALEEKKKEKKKQEEISKKKEKQHKADKLKRKQAADAKKKKAALKKAEQEKQRKAAEKKAAEKKAAEAKRKEQQKKVEQEKQRLKEQKKRQEAEQKRKAEEEKKRQAELKRKEIREREEWERRSKGVIKRHVAMIAQKIERNWRQPLDAPSNLQCKIDIVLLPGGNVVSVKVVESSGHLSFDRSVETAVRRASPLPVPSDRVIFKEFEVMRLRFEPGR